MAIKQLSVFVENKVGRIAALTGILSDAKINFRAAVIAETTDFGIFRCIIEDPAAAKDVLQENGFNASVTDVCAITIPDEAGSLHKVLTLLADAGIDTKYLYSAITSKMDESIIILKTGDAAKTEALFAENGIKTFTVDELL